MRRAVGGGQEIGPKSPDCRIKDFGACYGASTARQKRVASHIQASHGRAVTLSRNHLSLIWTSLRGKGEMWAGSQVDEGKRRENFAKECN
jgi:hypothetical protein